MVLIRVPSHFKKRTQGHKPEVAASVLVDAIEVLFGAVFVQVAFSIEVGAADEIEFSVASFRFLLTA